MNSMTNSLLSSEQRSGMPQPRYVLTVQAGLHTGAKAEIGGGSLLVIGSAEDSDLILTDDGVVSHHCVIGQLGGTVFVKSLQGDLIVNNRSIGPGEQITLHGEGGILIGSASIGLHSEQVNLISLRNLIPVRRYRILALLLMFIFLLGFAWTFYDFVKALSRNEPTAQVHGLAQGHSLAHAGVFPAQQSASEKIFDPLATESINLARQVSEVFRLSGLSVKATAVSEGVIEVSGVFSDPSGPESIVHSRALRDIKALRQVRVVNLLGRAESDESDRKIVRLTAGLEPYFVTANGARYYLGARLKSGYTVIAIVKEHIRLVSDDGKERVIGAGAILE